MSSSDIYNILGKLQALSPKEEPVAQTTERVYESVEAQGSVLEGVKKVQASLEAKLAEHKKGVAEERETLKTKGGTIYKGGTYGTSFDVGDDGTKKVKHVPKKGQKGRPKKEKDLSNSPAGGLGKMNDPFGRSPDSAPKGKKGKVVKGKGNIDTVDEEVTVDKLEKSYAKHMDRANNGGGDKERSRAVKTLYVGGADKAEKAYSQYQKKKSDNVAESKSMFSKALLENVNFRKMVDEADMTVDEMLNAINNDIQAYRATGDMSPKLRDFMHLHNHMKKMDETAPVPYEIPAVQRKAAGADPLTPAAVQQQDAERSMHPGMTKLDAPLPAEPDLEEELNELAKLAGITDEGNAFTGKLATTPKGGEFELDGEEFTDHSALEESKKTNLADIARLSGIFQEGKDYGDTTYNEPPTYDNSPDEEVMGIEVQTQGGDGEVAGKEKAMHSTKPTFKNGDNPLAETKGMMKPAAEFDYVKEMGRDLMQAYQGIKSK